MENNEMEKVKLDTEELDEVAGGLKGNTIIHTRRPECPHRNRVKTGNERNEDGFLPFLNKHVYEYTCQDCGKTFWSGEE